MTIRRSVVRAYTLTELIVSVAVGVVIAAAVFWGFARYNRVAQQEAKRLEFLKNASALKEVFDRDLRVAVLNNAITVGRSLQLVQEINPLKDPGHLAGVSTFFLAGSNEPTLQFFRPLNEEFSVRASVSPSSFYVSALKSAVNPPAAGNPDLSYFWHAIRSGVFFSITNYKKTEIVQRQPSVASAGTSVNTVYFVRTADSSAFANSPTFVRTAERIQIRRDSATGRLVRLSSFRDTNSSFPLSTVLAEGVREFRVGMAFEDRDNDALILPASSSPIDRLATPDSFVPSYWAAWMRTECAAGAVNVTTGAPFIDASTGSISPRCVKPKDLSGLAIRIVMDTDLPESLLASADSSPHSVESAFGGFRYQLFRRNPTDTKLSATVDFYLDIESHRRVGGAELAQGTSGACLNPTQSRCKPSCSSAFRDTDINSPWWIGYGRHAGHENPSSFCMGWNPNPSDEGQRAQMGNWSSIPLNAWSDSSYRTRMTHLGNHYGCITEVIQRHPGYRLACDCLRGGPNGANDFFVVPQTPSNRPAFESLSAPQTRGYALRNGMESSSGTSPELGSLSDPTNSRLRCQTYQNVWDKGRSCDLAVRDYFGVSTNAFLNRCQCLTTEIPFACDLSSSNAPSSQCLSTWESPIHRQHIDFRKICNIDYRRNPSSAALACPNTMFVNNTTTPQLTIGSKTIDFSFWPSNASVGTPYSSIPAGEIVYNLNETSLSGLAGKLAMSSDLAAACECFEKETRGIYNQYDWVPGNQNNPPSFPLGLNIDFRKDVPLTLEGVPTSASNRSEVLQFYAIQPQSWAHIPTSQCQNWDPAAPWRCNPYVCTTFNEAENAVWCWVGGQLAIEPTSLTSCSYMFCKLMGSGPNCCQAGLATEGVGNHDAVLPELSAWADYCSWKCQPRGSSPLITEINAVRRVITGTPPNGNLPPTCGGPQGGTAQGTQGF